MHDMTPVHAPCTMPVYVAALPCKRRAHGAYALRHECIAASLGPKPDIVRA